MDRQELSALLARLRTELAATPSVDPSLRQSLQGLEQDIQRVLALATAPAANDEVATVPDDVSADADIQALARTLETRLEADHPYLVSTLRDLMDRLGKMGI